MRRIATLALILRCVRYSFHASGFASSNDMIVAPLPPRLPLIVFSSRM